MAEGEDPIESILKELGISPGEAAAPPPGTTPPTATAPSQASPPVLPPAPPASPPAGGPPAFESFGGEGEEKVERHIDLLMNVGLDVKVELGRTRRSVKDILRLGKGSIVELDKLAGDALLDIFVNDRLVARGEVLVLNDNFCVRITEIVGGKNEK